MHMRISIEANKNGIMKTKLSLFIIVCLMLQLFCPALFCAEKENIVFDTSLLGNADFFISCYVFSTIKIVTDMVTQKSPMHAPLEKKDTPQPEPNSTAVDCILATFPTPSDSSSSGQLSVFLPTRLSPMSGSLHNRDRGPLTYRFIPLAALASLSVLMLPRGALDDAIILNRAYRTVIVV